MASRAAQQFVQRPTGKPNPWPLFAGILAWYVVAFVLLPMPPVRSSVDEAWRAYLTWAFEHRLQFGVDIVFTYGPWGFLLEPRGTLSAYLWQVAGRVVLAVGTAAGIAFLATAWIASKRQRLLWTAAIVILADLTVLLPALLFLMTLPSLAHARGRNWVLALVVVATGLAACTKFTCFLMVAALLPVLVRRTHLYLTPAVMAAFAAFWLAAGQDLSNVPLFASQSFEVARGYAASMVAGDPGLEPLIPIALWGLIILWWSRYATPISQFDRWTRLGWLGFSAFLGFRHSVIRSDSEHMFASMLSAAVPLAILMVPFPASADAAQSSGWTRFASIWRGPGVRSYALRLVMCLVAAVAASGYSVIGRTLLYGQNLQRYPQLLRELLPPPVHAASEPTGIAAPTGSVDVFPSDLSYAIRNGHDLRNRPAIQAYLAYTAKLTALNAQFLEGPRAARTIYFHTGAIDGRFPTMEDSLAWRSLLTHYQPRPSSQFQDKFLVLERRDRPGVAQLTPILRQDLRVGESLRMPAGAGPLVWAKLRVSKTLTGRALESLYRLERLRIEIQTNRRKLDLVLVDETASAGFLLSPYVDSLAAMLALYQQPAAAEAIQQITILGKPGFAETIGVELYSMELQAPGPAF